ncbi:MAG: tetratricopeptide repeat protein [Asticcacaulis sp.]
MKPAQKAWAGLVSAVVIFGCLAASSQAADTVDQAIATCTAKVADTATKPDDSDVNTQFCRGLVASFRDKDSAKAHIWFLKSAENGYAPAQFFVATQFEHGDGVAKDSTKALDWILKAAGQELSEAEVAAGTWLYYGSEAVKADPARAVGFLRKAADAGDPQAQALLAEAYYDGKGVKQDYAEAVRWYTRAAYRQHPHAMFVLGTMYAFGKGVDKNEAAGLSWLKSAAELNDPQAQFQLARVYMEGSEAVKDLSQADMWFHVYLLNIPGAPPEEMARLEKSLTPEQINKAQTDAQTRHVAITKGQP